MKNRSGRFTQRVAAIGISGISCVLFAGAIVVYASWKGRAETLVEKIAEYDRVRAVAAYQPELARTKSGGLDASHGALFQGSGTAAVVSAELLTRLKGMAAARGIEVMQASDLPAKMEGPTELVGGSLQMTGHAYSIYGLLQEIEFSTPLLFVDRLDIRSTGNANDENAVETKLVVEIHVFGAVRSKSPIASEGGG
jgi:Type II secretion system (T2SS), protein M subtype b